MTEFFLTLVLNSILFFYATAAYAYFLILKPLSWITESKQLPEQTLDNYNDKFNYDDYNSSENVENCIILRCPPRVAVNRSVTEGGMGR